MFGAVDSDGPIKTRDLDTAFVKPAPSGPLRASKQVRRRREVCRDVGKGAGQSWRRLALTSAGAFGPVSRPGALCGSPARCSREGIRRLPVRVVVRSEAACLLRIACPTPLQQLLKLGRALCELGAP